MKPAAKCLTEMIRLQLLFFQRMLGSHRNDGLVGAQGAVSSGLSYRLSPDLFLLKNMEQGHYIAEAAMAVELVRAARTFLAREP